MSNGNTSSPHRINCKRCPTYQRTQGHGTTACIPCQQRGLGNPVPPGNLDAAPVIYRSVPRAIIDEIADTRQRVDVIGAIRLLPPELSAAVAMSVVAGLSQRCIAGLLGITHQAVSERLKQAYNIITVMLHEGAEM